MKTIFQPQDKFRILFYNSKISSRKVKENLKRYGFLELLFVTDESDLINTVKGLDPQVIIVTHQAWNDPHTPVLLQELRKSLDTPVIIWSDDLTEFISRKLLAFKNTYTLRLSDGFISLTEILQRIEMKIKNPKLWV